jgi:hypothetical protein
MLLRKVKVGCSDHFTITMLAYSFKVNTSKKNWYLVEQQEK